MLAAPLLLLAAVAAPTCDVVWTGAAGPDVFEDASWDLSGSTVTAHTMSIVEPSARSSTAAAS